MDNHPPARRPHKSPAHTVKDHKVRPQRLTRSPQHQSARGSRTSYSEFQGRQHLTAPFLPPFPPCVQALRPSRSAGRALCTPAANMGSGWSEIFPRDWCLSPLALRLTWRLRTRLRDHQPNPRKRALPDCKHALESRCENTLRVFNHFAVDANRTLLEFAVRLRIARREAGGRQQ